MLLQPVGLAGQRFFGQVGQQMAVNFRSFEGPAAHQPIDLGADGLGFKTHLVLMLTPLATMLQPSTPWPGISFRGSFSEFQV